MKGLTKLQARAINPDRPDLWLPVDCGLCGPCQARASIRYVEPIDDEPSRDNSLGLNLLLLVGRGYSMTSAKAWVESRRFCDRHEFKDTWEGLRDQGLIEKRDHRWSVTEAGRGIMEPVS